MAWALEGLGRWSLFLPQPESQRREFAEKLESLLHRAYHLQEEFGSTFPSDSLLLDLGERPPQAAVAGAGWRRRRLESWGVTPSVHQADRIPRAVRPPPIFCTDGETEAAGGAEAFPDTRWAGALWYLSLAQFSLSEGSDFP